MRQKVSLFSSFYHFLSPLLSLSLSFSLLGCSETGWRRASPDSESVDNGSMRWMGRLRGKTSPSLAFSLPLAFLFYFLLLFEYKYFFQLKVSKGMKSIPKLPSKWEEEEENFNHKWKAYYKIILLLFLNWSSFFRGKEGQHYLALFFSQLHFL